jgi:ABC-2 type transport system ATP-binding protein
MAAIEVTDLYKVYGELHAVDGLSFEVHDGEVFALLGPNGAGKTTTVEILEGHRRRTSGVVQVLGWDPETGGRDYREHIGIVLQEAGFEEDFTVRELVRLYRGMYPRRLAAEEVIELVGLSEKRNARVKSLSGGQRRRLDLALGLVGDPDLLFLDEPTTGFDPTARRRAWELVENLRALGKTVLLTTHYMDEAEHLADRLGVVVRGRLIACGTPEEIVAIGGASVVSFRLPEHSAVGDLPGLDGPLVPRGAEWQLRTENPTRALYLLTAWAERQGRVFPVLSVTQPSLEDVYLQLIADEQAGEEDSDTSAVPRQRASEPTTTGVSSP